MDSVKEIMQKVKAPKAARAISKSQTENGKNLKTVKKELEEKMNEKAKVFGFIGMEVYDLTKEKRIEIAEIQTYIDKMEAIDAEIQALEKQKEELERKGSGKNTCVCGYKLKPNDIFCPNCGEPVPGIVICSCGAQLDKNLKFCSACGKKIEDMLKEQEISRDSPVRECICGAKVPAGQFMCMECGRKIED